MQRHGTGAGKKRLAPGGLIPTGEFSARSSRPPNWGYIDQALVRECHVPSLQACLGLTLPDIQTLLGKFGSTEADPEWFVKAWRTSDPVGKIESLAKLLGED